MAEELALRVESPVSVIVSLTRIGPSVVILAASCVLPPLFVVNPVRAVLEPIEPPRVVVPVELRVRLKLPSMLPRVIEPEPASIVASATKVRLCGNEIFPLREMLPPICVEALPVMVKLEGGVVLPTLWRRMITLSALRLRL